MIGFLTPFLASPVWRVVGAAVAAVAFFGAVYYAGYSAGRAREVAAQQEQAARAAKERVNVEADLQRAPDAERSRLLDQWRR